MQSAETDAGVETPSRPSNGTYLLLNGLTLAFVGLLSWVGTRPASPVDPASALLPPVFAMVLLTAAAWLAMLVSRNVAVFVGRASVDYYRDYVSQVPDERIERPARLFNNLLQVPVLFYVVCLLMISTGRSDDVQLSLAWLFVATRVAHALIYVGMNFVPLRLCAWLCGCITLGVIWTRLALAATGAT